MSGIKRDFVMRRRDFPHGLRCGVCNVEIPEGSTAVGVRKQAVPPYEGPDVVGLQTEWAWLETIICHHCAYPEVWTKDGVKW